MARTSSSVLPSAAASSACASRRSTAGSRPSPAAIDERIASASSAGHIASRNVVHRASYPTAKTRE